MATFCSTLGATFNGCSRIGDSITGASLNVSAACGEAFASGGAGFGTAVGAETATTGAGLRRAPSAALNACSVAIGARGCNCQAIHATQPTAAIIRTAMMRQNHSRSLRIGDTLRTCGIAGAASGFDMPWRRSSSCSILLMMLIG